VAGQARLQEKSSAVSRRTDIEDGQVNIEGAGHWAHHDRLDEFLRLVRAFLSDAS
jgi:pimeloyl-ACP methyl ester carboxylesterase